MALVFPHWSWRRSASNPVATMVGSSRPGLSEGSRRPAFWAALGGFATPTSALVRERWDCRG
jgi:hypothetical protein